RGLVVTGVRRHEARALGADDAEGKGIGEHHRPIEQLVRGAAEGDALCGGAGESAAHEVDADYPSAGERRDRRMSRPRSPRRARGERLLYGVLVACTTQIGSTWL